MQQAHQQPHSGGLLSFAGWGITLEWTEDEQRMLELLMSRCPVGLDPLHRTVRIAAGLPRKSVRDVALRMRWTQLQQQLKRRTGTDPRQQPGVSPLAQPQPMLPSSNQAPALQSYPLPPPAPVPEGPPTIDGPIAHLLDANLAILNQFRANMAAFKVHDNTQLLVQFRDNILNILHVMEAMGGVMSQLPQLPVRLNVDLANNFLPSRPAALSYDGLVMPPPPQPALNAPGMVPLNGFAPGAPGGSRQPPQPHVPTGVPAHGQTHVGVPSHHPHHGHPQIHHTHPDSNSHQHHHAGVVPQMAADTMLPPPLQQQQHHHHHIDAAPQQQYQQQYQQQLQDQQPQQFEQQPQFVPPPPQQEQQHQDAPGYIGDANGVAVANVGDGAAENGAPLHEPHETPNDMATAAAAAAVVVKHEPISPQIAAPHSEQQGDGSTQPAAAAPTGGSSRE